MRQPSPVALKLIAVYYLMQGLLLLALGLGGLFLLHQDHQQVLERWLHVIHVDPDSRYLHRLLTKLPFVNDRLLEELCVGTFVYAGLAFAQGGGLLSARRWASYLTVLVIASFIPLELYAILQRWTVLRLAVLALNGVIVWYLLAREWRAVRAPGTPRETTGDRLPGLAHREKGT